MFSPNNISIRQRLIFSNYLMIIVPIALIALMGFGLFTLLDATGNTRQNELALLLPKSGKRLYVEFSLEELIKQLHKRHLKESKLEKIGEDLKEQDVSLAVYKGDTLFYHTPNSDAAALKKVLKIPKDTKSLFLSWEKNEIKFYYCTPNGTCAYAYGNVPFMGPDETDEHGLYLMYFLEIFAFLAGTITIAIIIALGLFLSRRLSSQILKPLDDLKKAAGKIASGKLDFSLSTQRRDELGELCNAFEKMRLQLRKAQEEQQRYEQNRKELIAGISHDLSTPLTSVKGYASGIIDGIAATEEKRLHYINMIYKNACTMEKLVENLFLFSKLDLGKVEFKLQIIDICAYLKDYIEEYAPLYESNGLKITFLGTSARIKIDHFQFQRVIENICKNSARYKKGASGHLQIDVTKAGHFCRISCADDGCGVPESDLKKLFDSFYRTDKARSHTEKGSGLGLAIAKRIIEGLNGTIEAKKSDLGGLCIEICLPLEGEENEKNPDN